MQDAVVEAEAKRDAAFKRLGDLHAVLAKVAGIEAEFDARAMALVAAEARGGASASAAAAGAGGAAAAGAGMPLA